jgi:CRP-like cAMP-binding protein
MPGRHCSTDEFRAADICRERLEGIMEVRFFRTLTEDEEKALILRCTRAEMKKGEVLFRKGEKSTAMYLVEKGEFQVTDDRPGQKIYIASIRAGGIIGEMAFLDESPRSANLTAKDDAIVWKLSKEDFLRVLLEDAGLGARLLMAIGTLLVERLRKADAALTSISTSPVRQVAEEPEIKKAATAVREL